jgi:hypothetical protein
MTPMHCRQSRVIKRAGKENPQKVQREHRSNYENKEKIIHKKIEKLYIRYGM